MSTVPDCEMVVVASRMLGGSFLANAGLMVSSAVRTLTAASAESTLTRRVLVARKICRWARATNSWTFSFTSGVAIAAEIASVTTGRAAETKFETRASRSVAWSAT